MENRKFSQLRRWAREGIILVLLALAVMWGVDQYRKPTLPATFSATPMQGIDGSVHDIAALSQDRPLLIYVWATGAASVAIPRLRSIGWQKKAGTW